MPATLNGPLIRQLRLHAGLSRRELAPRLNVSQTAVRSIETDRNHDELTLRQIRALGHALGVPLNELFLDDITSSAPDDDAATVTATIALLARPTHRDALSLHLGWTLQRTVDALHAARAALTGTGLLLTVDGDHCAELVPLPSALRTPVLPAGEPPARLDTVCLELLRHLRDHPQADVEKHLTPTKRRALSTLMAHRLVDYDGRAITTPDDTKRTPPAVTAGGRSLRRSYDKRTHAPTPPACTENAPLRGRRPWTRADRQQLRELAESGIPRHIIALRLQRTVASIDMQASRQQVSLRRIRAQKARTDAGSR